MLQCRIQFLQQEFGSLLVLNGKTLSNTQLLGWHTRKVLKVQQNRRKTVLIFTGLKRKERNCDSNAFKLFVALQILARWRRLII